MTIAPTIESYISQLSLSEKTSPIGRIRRRGPGQVESTSALPTNLKAAVDVGSILSFVDGVDTGEREDILFSVQLAARAADGAFGRFTHTKDWYGEYNKVLQAVGWATEQFAFATHDQAEGDFSMDKAALSVIASIATGNQLQAITASISALEKLAESDGAIMLFDYHSARDGAGNFQIGSVQKSANGALSMALGAFYFHSAAQRHKFLFWRWGANDVKFWAAAQKMTFNRSLYDTVRTVVQTKLGGKALDFIAGLKLV